MRRKIKLNDFSTEHFSTWTTKSQVNYITRVINSDNRLWFRDSL